VTTAIALETTKWRPAPAHRPGTGPALVGPGPQRAGLWPARVGHPQVRLTLSDGIRVLRGAAVLSGWIPPVPVRSCGALTLGWTSFAA